MSTPPDHKMDGNHRTPPDDDSDASRHRIPTVDEDPGVPGFRTWRGVYLFVFGCFVAVVILLAVFTRAFA